MVADLVGTGLVGVEFGLVRVGVGLEWVGSWAGVGLGLGCVCSCLCTQAKMQKTITYLCNGPCPLCHDPCDSYGILWKYYDVWGLWLPHSIIYYHGSYKACVHHIIVE